MKKMLLMLGVAAAAMTSCTSDEVLEMNPTNTIKFESFVNKGTRAVTPTIQSGLTQFYVFGSYGENDTKVFDNIVFDNIAVTYDNTANNWKPNEEAEWTKNVYTFAAYATANGSRDINDPDDQLADAVSFSEDGLKFTNYVVSDDEDLVAAIANVDNREFRNPEVPLTFKHMLSQVTFEFTNLDSKHKLRISDLEISNVKNKGTGILNSGGINGIISWPEANLSVHDTYQLSYVGNTIDQLSYVGNTIDPSAIYQPEFKLVIPQSLSSITLSFVVEFIDTNGAVVDQETFTNIPLVYNNADDDADKFTAWQPGYKYTYTANFPSDPKTIRFGVTVEDWDNKTASGNNARPDDNTMDF